MSEELTPRELQICELIAWGACRKEIPDILHRQDGKPPISINTVNNIIANIYAKLSLSSETELSAWYFCEYHGVDSSRSPLKELRRIIYAIILFVILIPQLADIGLAIRPGRTAPVRQARVIRSGGRGSGRSRRTYEDTEDFSYC